MASKLVAEKRTAERRMADMSEFLRRRAPRNRIDARHKFSVGAHVLCEIGVRPQKAPFEVMRQLPDGGAGLQYRIKGERDGVERVVIESELEAPSEGGAGA